MDGKRTDKGLGGFPSVGLSEARRLAESNRVALARGRNPWQSGTYAPEARVPIDIPNFEQTARRFHQVNLDAGGWTNVKNVAAWLGRAEKYLFPKIGGCQVDLISAAEIRDQILIPVALEKPETAKRLRIILKQVFEYAVESEYIDFNPIDRIPARRLRRPSPKRFDAPEWQDMPAILEKIQWSEAWAATKLCFRFMVLTAARPSEARLARWSEIDHKDRVWSIPASRMKSRRPHRVPLSIQTAVLLDEVRRLNKGFLDFIDEGDSYFYGQHHVVNQAVAASQLIFPSPNGQPLSESALNIRARKTANVTAHGTARRAFRNWAAESGASWEVSELALAHTVGTPTSRAYFSSDLLEERRDLMQAWGDFCLGAPPF